MLQNKWLKLVCIGISSWLTVSCSASDDVAESLELDRSSIVVVMHPSLNLSNKTHFLWTEDHADISGKFQNSEFDVEKILDTAIERAIKSKHYTFGESATNNLLVHYHVSLESEMDDTSLAIRYGLAPGLRSNSEATQKYERGTLVVDFIDPQQLKVVWRGAIGAFTGRKYDDQARQKRVDQLLVNLFSHLPEASQ